MIVAVTGGTGFFGKNGIWSKIFG